MSHGGLKRARSWKRRIQPKEAYSSPGLLYSEEPVPSRGSQQSARTAGNKCGYTNPEEGAGGTPCLDGRRQPSLGGTSRMNREVGSGRQGCKSGKVKVLPPSVACLDG